MLNRLNRFREYLHLHWSVIKYNSLAVNEQLQQIERIVHVILILLEVL